MWGVECLNTIILPPTLLYAGYSVKLIKIIIILSFSFIFQTQVKLVWTLCFALAAYTIVSPYQMGLEGYKYEHYPAAMFAAVTPILWGLFMCIAHWCICNDYVGELYIQK